MTRLEVDIDTEKRGEGTVVSTNLRVVRECTTPRDNAKLEAHLAHALRHEIIETLKTLPTVNPDIKLEDNIKGI